MNLQKNAQPTAAEGHRLSARDRIGSASPAAEGAPSPFAAGDHRWLLLFRRPAAAAQGDAEDRSGAVEVEFNPAVVAYHRRVNVAGAVLLYEVELRPAAEPRESSATVATLDGGARLRVSDLVPSWELASPGFRLASLAAKLTELEEMAPASRPRGDLAAVLTRARTLAGELPGNRPAAELLGRAERLSN
jgi:hypothetical protein